MAAAPSEEELEELDEELEDGAEASRPCAVASQVCFCQQHMEYYQY